MRTGQARVLASLLAGFVLASCAQPSVPDDTPQITAAEIPIAWHAIHVESGRALGEGSVRPMLPASTAKLVTALAVLDRYPKSIPTHATTRLCRNGDAVILTKGFDPTFDLEDLFGLAIAGREGMKGAKRLVYWPEDEYTRSHSHFYEPIQPAQPADAAYNPRLYELMVAEGAYRGHRSEDGSGWTVPPGAPIPNKVGTDWFAHPNPPRQAADLFRAYAAGLGIDLLEPEAANLKCSTIIAEHESASVHEVVREMLWTSSNPVAEIMGRIYIGPKDPTVWLTGQLVDYRSIALNNFSGLDSTARVTPAAMARLLAKHADLEVAGIPFPAMLTPAGWDGGLKHRMVEPPLALNFWGKTGTMHYGAGLAGYMLVPGKGMHAVAVYAFDEEARAAYDAVVLNPPEEMEAAAGVWRRRARAEIDRTLLEIYKALSAG